MISEPPVAETLVYLDANVLVASSRRTFLIMGAALSAYRFTWSPYAEAEALRHQDERATPISVLRERYGWKIVPDADMELRDTDAKDQPILSAAARAGAHMVITENVTDFGEQDLARLGMSAVHPDLFCSVRLSASAYGQILDTLAETRTRFPRTPHDIHVHEVGEHMPMLAAAMSALFPHPPIRPNQGQPKLTFRGTRCIACGKTITGLGGLQASLHADCRPFSST